ncbi:hypothetical protein PT974_01380 [Cladobotryum mycophilum]|uniref:Uncharacterized protein n=1 Tax=Cladobotryum mycophilum TaxID=491253 RepID=A0ABR0T3H5_9HYPO
MATWAMKKEAILELYKFTNPPPNEDGVESKAATPERKNNNDDASNLLPPAPAARSSTTTIKVECPQCQCKIAVDMSSSNRKLVNAVAANVKKDTLRELAQLLEEVADSIE